VNRIEKNYIDNRQKIYRKLVKKNETERDNYINSLNKYLKEQEQLTELKKEKAFKKYQGYVSPFNNIYYYFYKIVFHNESNKRKKRRKINRDER
jgi:hypothetical protein